MADRIRAGLTRAIGGDWRVWAWATAALTVGALAAWWLTDLIMTQWWARHPESAGGTSVAIGEGITGTQVALAVGGGIVAFFLAIGAFTQWRRSKQSG